MPDQSYNQLIQNLLKPFKISELEGESITLKHLFDKRLKELGISPNQAEKLLNIERKSLIGILDGTAKRVDVVNILKLGNFLNLNPERFLQIYVPELPKEMIGELEKARKSNFIVSHFDVSNLKKANFLNSKSDFNQIESRITKFFNLESIFQYEENKVFSVFSRTKRASNNNMREFWVKSAYIHFIGINNPHEYDRDALVDLIPKIRPYTMNVEKGLLTVTRALYNVGVTVLYQPYLPTVQVRGATFIVNDKPCVVLTDLNKNYPTLWFALMHELHHVLYDLDTIGRFTYHITGESDLMLMNEDKADEFSRDYLFSKERSKYIAPFINNEMIVRQYAAESQVHPSIIYNFYNYDQTSIGNSNAWSMYKHYFPNVKQAIHMINANPWELESIQESIRIIKESVFNLN